MQLAEGPVSPRVPLLLLELWVLLVPMQCFQGRPSWRYISSEVVIPQREAHRGKGLQVPGWLSYSLHFGGQRHVIHLHRKKLIWPRHLLVMTQDDQGALQMDYPFISTDCYYLGHLEAFPHSTVTVDTCYGGLDGVMKLDDLAYEIKPLKDSQKFEHVVSQIVADANATGPTYGPEYKMSTDVFPEADFSVAPRMSSRDYSSHAASIKGQVICSRAMYGRINNMTLAIDYFVELLNMVSSYMQSIDIRFYIYILTIFNANDPASLSNRNVPGSPMHNYYVTNFFTTLRPDSSILVDKDGPHELSFEPFSGGMCQANNLVFVGIINRHDILVATVICNRLGRSLGLDYDSPGECVCQRRATCLMYRYPEITDAFSNCSYVGIQQVLGVPDNVACIFNSQQVYLNESTTRWRCGNKMVEGTEQCDCGSLKECYSNECCMNDCSLAEGSICDKGSCCTNCSFSPTGTLCRTIQNICDLPEYCRGNSLDCPEDTYLQDGTPCTQESYCYHGNCTDLSVQCKEIFGANAQQSHEQCYQINSRRFRFGFCLRSDISLTYTACSDEDRFCGRLQCANVTHLPRLQEHVSFHQSRIVNSICFGLDEHRSTGTTDVGMVRTGTPCAVGKMCDRAACNLTIASLSYDCTPQKCNFRGVCNNHRNCHCHIGWDPPQCKKVGFGGSVDSGPPPKKVRSVRQSILPLVYLRILFGRLYAFILALLFGVGANVRTLKLIMIEEEDEDEDEEDEDEDEEDEIEP